MPRVATSSSTSDFIEPDPETFVAFMPTVLGVDFVQSGHKVVEVSKMCIFRKWQRELHNPLLFHRKGPACKQAVIREL